MDLQPFLDQCLSDLLSSDPNCVQALKYLTENRMLSEPIIKDFSLGYCNPKSPKKEEYLKLCRKMNEHIVVPIKSEFGKLVALAIRKPSKEESGWWNQPFDKKNHLFLLSNTKKHIFEKNKVYVFEGYMDSIIAYQYGINNCCSLMGTSLGHRRLGFLARYCENICLCFDSDVNESGDKAQKKSIYEMNQYGWNNISIINLPPKTDPDEFIIKNGKDAFLGLERKLSKKEIIRFSYQYVNLSNKNEKR